MDKFLNFLASKTGKIVMTLVVAVVIFGLLMMAISSHMQALMGIAFLVCAIFGWKALNRITPNFFLVMSFAGWAIYFLIKGLLSIFIGVFVAPFQIAKMISNAVNDSLNN